MIFGFLFHSQKNSTIYSFPQPIYATTPVEGVGFEDLNGDGDTDVIIAGSCLGAKDSYPQNAIYENFNNDFRTYPTQNENIRNLKTVSEIKDYVKRNKNKFFDN